ncbi:MAG: N-acetylmuramoyl-L-alanine amidase [Acidobacteriota bacterium]|nr:N-acetylmuramoyl-L-alanine amidase [Acidobacteriota bacterium]
MRWSKWSRWNRRGRLTIAAAAGALLLLVLPAVRSADDKRLAVFSQPANYSVAIVERDGRAYVPLDQLLDPLAHPEIRADGKKVRIRAGEVEAELRAGKSKVKVARGDLDLGAKVLFEDGHALIPLHTVPLLLSRLLGISSDLHEGAHRLIVSGMAVRFTAELKKGEPPALVLNFSSPVNPSISTEPGRLKLVFTREAVVSTSESFKFDDPNITAANYSESGGAAELDVSGKVPLLASFSDGGKTITIAPAPAAAPVAAAQAPAGTAPPALPATETPLPTGPGAQPMTGGSVHPRYLVVIDPAHGGEDGGAKLSDKLQEKEVTLAFARRLRAALAERGISAHLLREGDTTIGSEQRAASANNLHASVYVSVHAGTPGSGVRLYTSLLADAAQTPAAFYPWETAQSFFVRPSRIVAQAAVEELGKRKVGVLLMPANIRPMNNVAAAVIGVELAAPASGPERVTAPRYQDAIAAAVAQGIVNARPALEAPR